MVLRQIVVPVGALFVANPGPQTSGAGGGLADLLKGGLGGLLAGGAARRCSERRLKRPAKAVPTRWPR